MSRAETAISKGGKGGGTEEGSRIKNLADSSLGGGRDCPECNVVQGRQNWGREKIMKSLR